MIKLDLEIKVLLMTFVISVICGLITIPILKKLKVGQIERDDGPASHLKKQGTPTMGGIIMIIAIIIAVSCTYIFLHLSGNDEVAKKLLPMLLITIGYGLIGFLIYGFKIGTETYIPILKMYINIPEFLYIPLAIIVVLATTNAVNLTDGIDGLSSSVSAIIITCLTVIGISNQVYEVSIFGSIVIGATLGFLMFNLHPAKVFMGDTGSLMLGGVISGLALYLKMPLLLILIAIIPVLETLSVIIQVAYFKKTGNRIFKMAPLHHHFELSGWKENKVVVVFSLITLIACFIGLKIV